MKRNRTRYPDPVIAERIQQVFYDNGLNDSAVARDLGWERKAIGQYRRCESNPPIRFIKYLANRYKVDVYWLLDIRR